jgi:hypothetical protein
MFDCEDCGWIHRVVQVAAPRAKIRLVSGALFNAGELRQATLYQNFYSTSLTAWTCNLPYEIDDRTRMPAEPILDYTTRPPWTSYRQSPATLPRWCLLETMPQLVPLLQR